MKVGLPRALRRFRQELQQNAPGPPAAPRAALAAEPFLADRDPHPGRDLLGAQEIFMRGVFKAAAVKRDHALITAHVGTLVDRHRQMPLAEQGAGIDSLLDRSEERR